MDMKKLMLGVIIVMALLLVLGLSWGKLFKRGYTQDEYGDELAKRDQKIEQLEDSIRIMQAKLSVTGTVPCHISSHSHNPCFHQK